VSFKIIMSTSVRPTRSRFTTQHQTCKTKTITKTKTDFFWPQTGLVLRSMVSYHITDQQLCNSSGDIIQFFWQFSLPAQRAYRHTARQRIASDITLTNHATRTCFSAPIHANNGLICRLVTIAYVDPAYCRCGRKLITALDCVCPCS